MAFITQCPDCSKVLLEQGEAAAIRYTRGCNHMCIQCGNRHADHNWAIGSMNPDGRFMDVCGKFRPNKWNFSFEQFIKNYEKLEVRLKHAESKALAFSIDNRRRE